MLFYKFIKFLMSFKFKKGFTLIELLVVIAIIGLLTSVVLASLNSARVRAANASIQSNLVTVRAQSEIYFDSNAGSYSGLFDAGSVSKAAFDSAVSASAEIDEYGETGYSASEDENWTALVKLRGESAYWCVDNSGFSGLVPYPDTDPSGFANAMEEFGSNVPTLCSSLEVM